MSERPARPETADDDPVVASVMARGVVGIVPDATLRVALQLMIARHVRHLPVIDGSERYRVVTETDLLRGTIASRGPLGLASLRVADVARAAAVVPSATRMSQVAQTMERSGGDVVLVEENGDLVGIVTASDVITCMAAISGTTGPGPTVLSGPDERHRSVRPSPPPRHPPAARR
ncbi:hypothetical protein TOK_2532 [Pseudonocardia sp. N23]|nr:hypothetical protein TOK_2532 [Pseudonocardia sp. N23]